ncbi:hypothetical protein AALP_AA8G259100 [Arabis alpina]|uniref:Uncharacterized protein n=1 Tax=Arabis alpina TaxID=50452 RepID=A0A087G9G3_ARAAL|nr:hypothetical protein AALP_AA8G259100 [Arabis alpina]
MEKATQVNRWFPNGRSPNLNPSSLSPSLPPPPLPPDPPDPAPLDPSTFPPLSFPKSLSSSSPRKPLQTASLKPVDVASSSPLTIPTAVEINSLLQNFTSIHPLSGSEGSRSQVTVQKGFLESQKIGPELAVSTTKPLSLLTPVKESGIVPLPTPVLNSTKHEMQGQSVLLEVDKQQDKAGTFLLQSFALAAAPIIPKTTTIPNLNHAETWAGKMKKASDKTLKRLAPPSNTTNGIPRIEIPDEVFIRGAALH